MTNETVNKTRLHFLEAFKNGKDNAYPYLSRHIAEVERWVKKILKFQPKADKKIVLLSVWLHDIGQTIKKDGDHAVVSKFEIKRFLTKIGLKTKEIDMVAHCVRAHRCRDVQPETLEAKILAVADLVSHMTDINYIVHFADKPREWIIGKLERDYRDIGISPNLKREITPLYRAWKKLITVYPNKI